MDKKQKQTHPEVGEDATQYGEFISTYFAWIPLPDQKEKAGEMARMTEKEKNAKQNRYRIREIHRGGKINDVQIYKQSEKSYRNCK